jgi:hypothetical protein
VSTLGVKGTKDLIGMITNANNAAFFGNWASYPLRGDTLASLLELVQSYFLRRLQSAAALSMINARAGIYPQVEKNDLQMIALVLHYQGLERRIDLYIWTHRRALELEMIKQPNYAVVRKLAYIAGIVKMTNESIDFLWEQIVLFLSFVLAESITYAKDYQHPASLPTTKTLNEEIDLYSDVPEKILLPEGSRPRYEYVIVPRLLEIIAKAEGLQPIYGAGWIAETSVEREQEEALASYRNQLVPSDVNKPELIMMTRVSTTNPPMSTAPCLTIILRTSRRRRNMTTTTTTILTGRRRRAKASRWAVDWLSASYSVRDPSEGLTVNYCTCERLISYETG